MVAKYDCCTPTLSVSPYGIVTAGLCSQLRLFFILIIVFVEIFDPSVRYTGLAVAVHPHSPPQHIAENDTRRNGNSLQDGLTQSYPCQRQTSSTWA